MPKQFTRTSSTRQKPIWEPYAMMQTSQDLRRFVEHSMRFDDHLEPEALAGSIIAAPGDRIEGADAHRLVVLRVCNQEPWGSWRC